ncbi:MAG: hypothetical protein JRF60_13245 [Deltaproteobacteria bacterium]|nr:hypothetical protein [Deltaproteobacteria bacterium]
MSILPDYDVIVWLHYNKFGEKIEKDILSSVGIEPYERYEHDGVLDMHWGFKTWDDAKSFSKKMEQFAKNPNVIFLKASNIKNSSTSIVYKDERYKNHNS